MIRKITRGTRSVNNTEVTISCTITDTGKVMVLLDVDGCVASTDNPGGGSAGVYLVSVSNTGIVVKGYGISTSGYSSNTSVGRSSITFSYQIIEFM